MRIIKLVLIVFLICLTVGCSKEEGCGCTIISLGAHISLANNAGEDLLNPNDPNSYKKRDIKTYHLIDGEQIRAGQYDNLYEDEVVAGDIVHVEIDLLDIKGNLVQNDDRNLQFSVDGDATIIGLTNGNIKSLEPFTNKETILTYKGRCLCIIRIGSNTDNGLSLKVSSEGLKGSTIKL